MITYGLHFTKTRKIECPLLFVVIQTKQENTKVLNLFVIATYRCSNVTRPEIMMPCQENGSEEPKEKPAQ